MSEHGGPVRDPATIHDQVDKAWDLWHRLNSELKPVAPPEIILVLRIFDLCLTHAVYLEAIAEYLDKSGNPAFVKDNILEIWLDEGLKIRKEWVPVRPVPKADMWFELVWKEFRDNQRKPEER
jgi:hypothetical protein